MLDRVIVVLSVSVFFLAACGATPAEINNRGNEAYLEGDYATALQSYRDAQERSPVSGEPLYGAANALYRLGRYEDSLEDYDESIEHATGELRARAFFNRGNAAFNRQQYGQAVEAYEEVLRINPDDGDAKHNLELALRRASSEEQDQGGQQQDQGGQQQAEEQAEDAQRADEQEQDQPTTEAQVRQLLESVGRSAQTLQERRGQVLVSPEPPSEFDW